MPFLWFGKEQLDHLVGESSARHLKVKIPHLASEAARRPPTAATVVAVEPQEAFAVGQSSFDSPKERIGA